MPGAQMVTPHPRHSTDESCEQRPHIGGGESGGKAADQRTFSDSTHYPTLNRTMGGRVWDKESLAAIHLR